MGVLSRPIQSPPLDSHASPADTTGATASAAVLKSAQESYNAIQRKSAQVLTPAVDLTAAPKAGHADYTPIAIQPPDDQESTRR